MVDLGKAAELFELREWASIRSPHLRDRTIPFQYSSRAVYVADVTDLGNGRVREINKAGRIVTVAVR
jgi:hypothetical protein